MIPKNDVPIVKAQFKQNRNSYQALAQIEQPFAMNSKEAIADKQNNADATKEKNKAEVIKELQLFGKNQLNKTGRNLVDQNSDDHNITSNDHNNFASSSNSIHSSEHVKEITVNVDNNKSYARVSTSIKNKKCFESEKRRK